MPELPEVETIKNALIPRVSGVTIKSADVLWAKAVRAMPAAMFMQRVSGETVQAIRRRGKYLLFDLVSGKILGIHLKMTGVLLLNSASEIENKYTTAVFYLGNEMTLHFIDQRKFGSLWLAESEGDIVGKLGPEPLEGMFGSTILKEILSRHQIPIKAAICDQHFIAGLGNMYSDEALFAAGIHPLRRSNALADIEVNRLHDGIIEVLQRGIRHNGASINTYCLPDGTRGMAQTQFKVAHRIGEPCPVCGSAINRIKIRGRGSYFCPYCQPAC